MKRLSNYDLGTNELQNAVIQNLAAAPSSPKEGQIYYNTTSNKFNVFNGVIWDEMGSSSATGDMSASVYDPQSISGDAFARGNHTGTQSADTITDGTTNKAYTAGEKTKLAGIEAGADVTDATNVDAAGAVMNTDLSTADMQFVINEANMASNSATKIPTQQSVKAYTDSKVAALVDTAPGTLDTLNELAAALGDDPNFATTMSTNVGTKVAKDQNLADLTDKAAAFANIKQSATTTATGVVELATSTEAEARTDSTRAVTPSALANFPVKKTFTVGGATTATLTHNLGTLDVITQVRQASDNEVVECDIVNATTNTVTLGFATAPAASSIKAVVMG